MGSVTWPVAFGSIKLGYDATDTRKRESHRQVKLVSAFSELNKMPCDDVPLLEPTRPTRYPIKGNIGLEEVIEKYLSIVYDQKQSLQTGAESYQDRITFVTTIGGGLDPSISVTKFPTHIISASASAGGSRSDTHQLTIFLVPPDPPASAAAQELAYTPPLRMRTRTIRQPPFD